MSKSMLSSLMAVLITCFIFSASAVAEEGYDMTLVAEGGTAKLIKDTDYEITLTGVHPNVLSFQDRPGRDSGHMEVGAMVAVWGKMFGDDKGPPNASMISRDLNGRSDDPIAITITGTPILDESSGSITFNATVLEGSPAPIERFTDVGLFIDPTPKEWAVLAATCGTFIMTAMLTFPTGGAVGSIMVGASVACVSAIVVQCRKGGFKGTPAQAFCFD